MSGTWEPAQKIEITRETLDQYVKLARDLDLDELASGFPESELGSGSKLMKLQASSWGAAESLDDSELEVLIRFFTKAEMELSGWNAGKTSPVIYLAKILKSRGSFDPELKRWVKANTDNRFLPNGAVAL